MMKRLLAIAKVAVLALIISSCNKEEIMNNKEDNNSSFLPSPTTVAEDVDESPADSTLNNNSLYDEKVNKENAVKVNENDEINTVSLDDHIVSEDAFALEEIKKFINSFIKEAFLRGH